MERAIEQLGYLVIFAGTFLEGETVLVLGGFAAHRGYLWLPGVLLAAFAGSLLGDQLYFQLGRRHGLRFLERRPAWRARLERALRLLERHPGLVIVGCRFLYGLRTVTPFAIGMSGVALRRFAPLNALGAALWAVAIGSAGYFVGTALERVIGDVERFEGWAFAAIAGAGLLAWAVHRLRGGEGAPP